MTDADITVGSYVYVSRRNIPGVPLKEGGRGKVALANRSAYTGGMLVAHAGY
jgi:hypothetical protein